MNRLTLALGLGLLVVVASVGALIVATSSHSSDSSVSLGLAVFAGVAFVLSGLFAIARRPENRTGVYLAAVGYLWFLGALSSANNAWLFTIGVIAGGVVFGPLTALALVHPTGRFGSRFEAAVPWIVVAAVVGFPLAIVLVDPTPEPDCDDCPENMLNVVDADTVGDALFTVFSFVGVALVVLIGVLMARRWRRASPALRRLLRPVFIALAAFLASLIVDSLLTGLVSDDASTALTPLFFVTFTAVPVSFLYGILRTRLAQSSVTELMTALDRGAPLRDALAHALGDPTLEISYRPAGTDRWVDASGRSVPEPVPAEGRAETTIEHAGLPIAVLDYDASLAEERELVSAVAAAASLLIQNERLYAGLRAQYAFLETMTDTTPSLLVSVDTDGRILDQNRAALGVAGVDDEELLRGRYFWDVFIDPRERGDVIARFRMLAPDFEAGEYENAFTNARGEERVVYWRAAPVRNEGGEVSSIVAGGLDVTERHQRELELQRERDVQTTVFESMPSIMVVLAPDGTIRDRDADDPRVGANRSFRTAVRWPDEEIVGRSFVDLLVEDEDGRAARAIARAAAGEISEPVESEIRSADGSSRTFTWSALPVADVTGRMEQLVLVSGVDVSERKERERELQRERDFLSATANAIPTLLALVDEECVVIDHGVNAAFKRTLGYADEDVVGRVIWDVLAPDEARAELEDAFRRCIAAERSPMIESRWHTRDGDVRLVEWTTIERPGAEGSRQFLISGNDVTVRRLHEEEIRASRARIVRAADEARRGLERNLHDGAQQRLVALSVALRLVESKLRDDPQAASETLTGAREELSHALEELRELARGIHPAVLTDRGLKPALDALAQRAPVAVELEAPSERLAPAVEAAAYYVVAESLANMAKHGRASSARVSLAALNGTLIVTVADDGVGGADPDRGSGLRGLADRVEALEGRLVVESPAGVGTTIRAEIPLHPSGPTSG